MITVPDEIKELLHLDHCKKNIRIHFPGGERSDICNDLIVKDSVSLTESLCSQNTLKFGLCESPVFECEVVGVGNVAGARIEVFCEIYCDASVSGAVFRPDLQAYVYPISYGQFVIDSCKREADMIHRRIQAYKEIAIRQWNISEAEKGKQIYESAYTPNLGYFLAANGINVIEPYTTEELYERWSSDVSFVDYSVTDSPISNGISIEVGGIEMRFYSSEPQRDFDALYRVELKSVLNLGELQNRISLFFGENNISANLYERNKIDFDRYTAIAFQRRVVQFVGSAPNPTYAPISGSNYLYPYLNNFYTSIAYARYDYQFPTYVRVTKRIYNGSSPIITTEKIDVIDVSAFKAYKRKITSSNTITDLRLTIPTNYPQDKNIDFSQFSDVQSFANGYAELLGIFGSYDRYGGARNVNIKRQFGLSPESELYPTSVLYPQGVTGGKLYPQDYQSCWYDDNYIKPFGKIECQYKNTNNEDCLYIYYLSGYDEQSNSDLYQTYSLDNNAIIKSTLWTEAQIEEICEYIASNIEGVSYMPVDFVGRGLPYVEAGDTFEILTKSNDSITTIVLNRTLSGEQTLTDSYKSV